MSSEFNGAGKIPLQVLAAGFLHPCGRNSTISAGCWRVGVRIVAHDAITVVIQTFAGRRRIFASIIDAAQPLHMAIGKSIVGTFHV